MKKIIKSVVAVIVCLTAVVTIHASSSSSQLYKYVKNSDGTYSYDQTQPIYYYNGSTEKVEIPDEYVQTKEQFKAMWVATIANLNFATPTSEEDFKTQYLKRIETMRDWNMNAMIFQVSPLLDAFYPSDVKPTSQYLSGTQGVDVSYDPLKWMVDTTHENGMEYHAWFNPYRVTNTKITSAAMLAQLGITADEAATISNEEHVRLLHEHGILADDNFAVLHPEWVLSFEDKLFLNPGIPEVMDHVTQTITEVITNYDVDGIHFDDYFYPYRVGDNYFGRNGEDRSTFETYGLTAGYEDSNAGLEQWRRDNVTTLVENIKGAIDTHNTATKSAVQLGISPFGIWEHSANDPRGSHTPTGSSQSYSNSIYADTYKWIKDNTLDYVAPQIYWSFGQAAAPYGELARWWNNVAEGTDVQVYVGHANYKHVSNGGWDAEWMNPEEISNQMRFNQNYKNIKGSILFSYNDVTPSNVASLPVDQQPKHQAKNDAIDSLKNEAFSVLPLTPAKPALSPGKVEAPQKVTLEDNKIVWEDTLNVAARYYVVYKGSMSESGAKITSNPANIVAKILKTDATAYEFTVDDVNSKYLVTTLDKAYVESATAMAKVPANTTDSENLYRYVKKADGTYGYDQTKPIYYYDESTEQVKIPETYTQEKQQFKGTWVATIANLNFATPTSEEHFKEQYLQRIEAMKEWNMNGMFFQVRPLLDAFYPSTINPTSEYLSGTQGVDVSYDPLKWMVDTTHENGMEYHAWFNPYRVTNIKITDPSMLTKLGITAEEAKTASIEEHIRLFNENGMLADNNFAVLHPEWVLRFDDKLFLNPGIPEVIQHVVDTIDEVITNYDVDGIHFDDYFYPYRIGDNYFGRNGEDRTTFETYGLTAGYPDTEEGLESWRRDNITKLVESIKDTIDVHNTETNSAVQLGISPFGIWEHYDNDERGSHTPTASSQSYSRSIYADTYKWMKDETLDYVLPQIYWSFGQAAAPYGELTRWWSQAAEGTNVQVYIGHANYKHLNNGGWDAEWMNPNEVNNQLHFNQNYDNVKGSVLFSYNDMVPSDIASLPADVQPKNQAKNDSIEVLKNDTFSVLPLSPAKPWLSPAPVLAPQHVTLTDNKITLEDTENIAARYYVVYKGTADQTEETIFSNPSNIIAKILKTDATTYEVAVDDMNAKYVVTTLDKAYVESTTVVAVAPSEETTTPVEETTTPVGETTTPVEETTTPVGETTTPVEESTTPVGETTTPVEESTGTQTDVQITIKYNVVSYDLGKKVTEEEFLSHIGLETDMEATITTDFSEKVNFDTKGEYDVVVQATPKATGFSNFALAGTNSVNIKVAIGMDPTGETTTAPDGSLVSTGENIAMILVGSGAAMLAGAVLLIRRKMK